MILCKKSIIKMLFICMLLLAFTASAFAASADKKYEDKLRIAVVNIQPVWGDKKANTDKIVSYAKEAADNGAQLILFPEMSLTGYALDKDANIKRTDRMQVRLAEEENGPTAQKIAAIAKEKKVYIVYGFPEKKGPKATDVYNAALAAGPKGIIGSYQKIHPVLSEGAWCKTGTDPFIFKSPWGPIGISICYDTYNYPELSRYYAASGVRLMLNPTATSWGYRSEKDLINGFPKNDGKPIDGNNIAWANRFKNRIEGTVVQSTIYVATANLVGAEKTADGAFAGDCFPGGSSVAGPTADETAENYVDYYVTNPVTAVNEGIIYSDIDLSTAKRNSFVNYLKNDLQEGNLYEPALYEKWFAKLATEYKEVSPH